ncbi:TOPRIM nucleotidyl transferase/hydrolase domain-containing protein [Thaumasiovibrio sp. DFM-14]|uniref:TOPRIM nucleotidyl transferase/hydrolase domain-containing protein n=1 Tax=Thaumasiovibrio sp. DFM-14 TaxID=3384792 RepID=UPI0039A00310
MSDRKNKLEADALDDLHCQLEQWDTASKESALEQCIYLFVEGESEEIAFRILLEEGLGVDFKKLGLVIANYNGIGNLKHTLRLMNLTLSHERPMIFTFDDDNKSLINGLGQQPDNIYLFKVPFSPVVTLPNGDIGGSFEESFEASDFINALFETTLLKLNPQVVKSQFIASFNPTHPFYDQSVKYLRAQNLQSYLPSKIEIAEHMAAECDPEPDTYVKLAELIKRIRSENPVQIKI